MSLSHALISAAREAERKSAGLQIFSDHLPQTRQSIQPAIDELVVLAVGLNELESRLEDPMAFLGTAGTLARQRRQRSTIEHDARLLLRSFNATLRKVETMFRATRFPKMGGDRPYLQAWAEFDAQMRGVERSMDLAARLELYSVFLRQLLDQLAGKPVAASACVNYRHRIEVLLGFQEPARNVHFDDTDADVDADIDEVYDDVDYSPAPPRARTPNPLPASSFPNMPGIPPIPPYPEDWDLPFNLGGMAGSPTASSASSQATWASGSQTMSFGQEHSWGQGLRHWAMDVFDPSKLPSTPFPPSTQVSRCYGQPSPNAIERLRAENYIRVAKLPIENDSLMISLFVRPDFRARILLNWRGTPHKWCRPITNLRLTRSGSSLELCNVSPRSPLAVSVPTFEVWARLRFPDYESMVLFHNVFVVLKAQDPYPPADILAREYFYSTEPGADVMRYAGVINYYEPQAMGGILHHPHHPPQRRVLQHALRLYVDGTTRSARLEARPYRGASKHVPIWTGFLRNPAARRIAGRAGSKTLEVRGVMDVAFMDGLRLPRGEGGGLIVDFVKKDDADDFLHRIHQLPNF